MQAVYLLKNRKKANGGVQPLETEMCQYDRFDSNPILVSISVQTNYHLIHAC